MPVPDHHRAGGRPVRGVCHHQKENQGTGTHSLQMVQFSTLYLMHYLIEKCWLSGVGGSMLLCLKM